MKTTAIQSRHTNLYPDAPAVLKFYRRQFTWQIVKCPFCGQRHVHGGGLIDDDPPEFLGWRVPHCIHPPEHGDQYKLVDLDPRQTELTIAATPKGKRGK